MEISFKEKLEFIDLLFRIGYPKHVAPYVLLKMDTQSQCLGMALWDAINAFPEKEVVENSANVA